MTDICSQCGKIIRKNETCYVSQRDGKDIRLHPACRSEWVSKNETTN
jgi:hypothetical protein